MPQLEKTIRLAGALGFAWGLCIAWAGIAAAQSDTLSVPEREDASPFLGVTPQGTPAMVWVASAPDTNAVGPFDEIAFAERGLSGWSAPEILAGPGTFYGPRVAYSSTGSRWTCWTEHDGTDTAIRIRRDAGGFTDLFTLDDPGQPDLEPSMCATRADSVLIVWQGWRGDNYEILMSAGDSTGFSPPAVVSTCGNNDREPRVVWGNNQAWIVWSAYEGEAYNLHHRRWDGASLTSTVSLTTNFRTRALHPEIHWDDGNGLLWVAWLSVNQGWAGFNRHEPALYDLGSPRVRAFDGTTLFEPSGLNTDGQYPLLPMETLGYERFFYSPTQPMEDRFGTGINVITDAQGRTWFLHQQMGSITEFGTPNTYWGLVGSNQQGGVWSSPSEFFEPRTTLAWEDPAVVVANDTLWVAWASDDRSSPIVSPPFLNLFGHDMQVVVRGVPLVGGPSVAPSLVTLGTALAAAPCTTSARLQHTILDDGVPLTLLWGDNHRHSVDLSWDASPDTPFHDTIIYSLDFLGHDWIVPSDHAERFSKAVWGTVRKFAMLYDIPNRYRVFAGYERSMRGGAGGDQNAIYRDPDDFTEASAAYPTVASWHLLYAAQNSIDVLEVPHTTSQCGAVMDWDHLAAGNPLTLPSPLRLVEIYQSARESFEYPGCPKQFPGCVTTADSGWVAVALANGLRLGFTSAGDHTIRAAFTGVYSADITRDAIWAGLQARRTMGTTRVDKANVEFRVNGALMGSEILASEEPTLTLSVQSDTPLAKIEINKNGNPVWFSVATAATDTTITLLDPDPFAVGTSSFYYVRIENADGNLFYTSPVWVTFTPETGVGPLVSADRTDLQLSAFPNPGRDAIRLDLSGLATVGGVLRIYDVTGRLVHETAASGGDSLIRWDGTDLAGHRLAAGRYFAVVQSSGRRVTTKLTLLR